MTTEGFVAICALALLCLTPALAQEATRDFIVPRASFVRLLDLDKPELAAVKAALDKDDVAGAETAYVAYFRARTLETPLLTNWSAVAQVPNWRRDYADRTLAGHIDDGYSVYDVPPTGLDWHNSPLSCVTRFPVLEHLRHAYHQTGDPKYARFMVEHMLGYVAAYPIEEFVGKHTLEGWVSHTTVARPWYWAMIPERLMEMPQSVALLRSSPDVSDEELLRLLHRMYMECGYLSTEIKGWVDRRHNGGCAMIEALAVSATVLSDFPQAQRWLDQAAELELQYLAQSFYPDGMCVELTTAYSSSVSQAVQGLCYALRDRPAIAQHRDKVEALITCMAGLTDPTGWLPSFGDLYATTADRGINAAAAQWCGLDYVKPLLGGRPGAPPPFLNWPLPGQEQWCGYYAMRSGWDPQGRYLAIDGGPWGTTHQHGDKLSFVVTALGSKFIIDPSGTRYAANTPDSFISRQASGFLHNTITIDGVDEFIHEGSEMEAKAPLTNRWETGDRHTLFAASYSFAPLKPVKWERRVLFADKRYWLVQDVLTGEQPEAQVEQNFQFEADIQISFEGNKTIATAPSGAKLVLVPLGGDLKPILSLGDKQPHTSYWSDGKPKTVLCREDDRDQVHGRGWTGRSGDKLMPAPAVTYTGTMKLPGTITLLLVPLTKEQTLADLPPVTVTQAEEKAVWALPVKQGKLSLESSLTECAVR